MYKIIKPLCVGLILFTTNIARANSFFLQMGFESTYDHEKTLTFPVIGQRLNDSTAIIAIVNSQINQVIIPHISRLANTTVTDDKCSLLMSASAAYLLFTVVDSNDVKSKVAVQLYENSSGMLTFGLGSGKDLHISQISQNCAGCKYIIQSGSIVVSNCTGEGCSHSVFSSI